MVVRALLASKTKNHPVPRNLRSPTLNQIPCVAVWVPSDGDARLVPSERKVTITGIGGSDAAGPGRFNSESHVPDNTWLTAGTALSRAMIVSWRPWAWT